MKSIPILPRYWQLIVCIALCVVPLSTSALPQGGYELFRQDKFDEARSAYNRELTAAQAGGEPYAIWQALMGLAWFENLTGHYRDSIEHANLALEIGTKSKNDFMMGRSLCWLGWSFASLGFYQAAIEFYDKAIAIGAPDGEIKIIPVWGLATQELGSLYFKMGDTKNAETLLRKTTDFARTNKIAIGVAEGGAHLAEVLLSQGDTEEAITTADEAVAAAIECGCSKHNTARAKLIAAKVRLPMAQGNSKLLADVQKRLEDTLTYAEAASIPPVIAETKILLSHLLPETRLIERRQLIESAYQLLLERENELRGKASAELGEVFFEAKRFDMAKYYLNQGIKINADNFRRVDDAYLLSSKAVLQDAEGETRESLISLSSAADRALESNSLPDALRLLQQLAKRYEEEGYSALAFKIKTRAHNVAAELLKKAVGDVERSKAALQILELEEQLVDLAIIVGIGAEVTRP